MHNICIQMFFFGDAQVYKKLDVQLIQGFDDVLETPKKLQKKRSAAHASQSPNNKKKKCSGNRMLKELSDTAEFVKN